MRICLIVIGMCASVSLGSPLWAETSHLTLYVSSNAGNDRNPGTLAKPFLTIERARDAIRELKMRAALGTIAVTVYLRGGIYPLTRTFALSEQDSGISGAPITYAAYQNEEVRLSGSVKLPAEAFQPVTQVEELKRLALPAIPHVRRADLKQLGLASAQDTRWDRSPPGQPEKPSPEELFFNAEVMQLARWPNKGWAEVASVIDAGSIGKSGNTDGRPGAIRLDNPRISQWGDAKVWLKGFWYWDWYDEAIAVRSIDSASHQVTLATPSVYGLKTGARYFAFNVLSELDQEGEYYIDRDASVVYFWPPTSLAENRVTFSLLLTPLVVLQNTTFVTLQGLIIEEGRDDGIQIRGGQGNHIRDCVIRNVGKDGVVIQGGWQQVITGSHVYNVGTRGIAAIGGDRKTLKAAEHRIFGNHVHHYGRRIATTKAGIDIDGVGIAVLHNDIHDAPHVGILFAGNEHVIQFNEIHRVCEETSDAGAIYVGRDWTARGNAIRYNFIHDLFGKGTRNDVTAIYLDDLASGVDIIGNVIIDVHRAILVGGGRDNRLENNVLTNCDIAISMDARGVTGAVSIMSQSSTLMKRLSAMPYETRPWSTRYPQLATILQDEPIIPKKNVLQRNIAYRCKQSTINPIAQLYGSIELPQDSDSDLRLLTRGVQDRPDSSRTPIRTMLPGWETVPFPDMGLPK
jgi:Right handed beta helix region